MEQNGGDLLSWRRESAAAFRGFARPDTGENVDPTLVCTSLFLSNDTNRERTTTQDSRH